MGEQWKASVLSLAKLSRNLLGGTEENYGKPNEDSPLSSKGLKLGPLSRDQECYISEPFTSIYRRLPGIPRLDFV
jgi:hypothetical protein